MPKNPPQLEWCIVRLGEDYNWWVDEISDPIHWDVDGLGIIDPRQIHHIVDLSEPLRDYGFDTNLFESAFFSFTIAGKTTGDRVKLKRSFQSILDSEDQLFVLPDILDEETGPYADFLDHITRLRVKLLNDLIDFDQPLTIDELEEELREEQNNDFIEGRAVHFFSEIVRILEYIPKGFELDTDDHDKNSRNQEDVVDLDDEFPDLEEDDSLEQDETMKWDEDEDFEEDFEEDEDLPPPAPDDDFLGSFSDDDEDDDDDSASSRKSSSKSKAKPAKAKKETPAKGKSTGKKDTSNTKKGGSKKGR
jgi:hypothetical protein